MEDRLMVKRSQQLQYSFRSTHHNLVETHLLEDPHNVGWGGLHQGSGDVLLRDADHLPGEEHRNRLVRDRARAHQIQEEPAEAIDAIVVPLLLLHVEFH